MKRKAIFLSFFATFAVIGLVVYLANSIYYMYHLPFVSFLVSSNSSFGDYRESEISYMLYDDKIASFKGNISNPKDIDPSYYDVLQGKKLIEESEILTLSQRYRLWCKIKNISQKDFASSKAAVSQDNVTHPFYFQVTIENQNTSLIIDIPDYSSNAYRSKGNKAFVKLLAEMMVICPLSEETCVSELNELNDWVNSFNGNFVKQKPSGFSDW